MSETYEESMRDLPLRTKKQRQQKFQNKYLSSDHIKSNLQEMIKTGIKNTNIIELIKSSLMNEKAVSELKIRPKRFRSEAEQEIISKIEEKQFNFFTQKGETANFKRGIDNVLLKLNQKTRQLKKRSQEESIQEGVITLSPLKTRYSKFSKNSSQMSKRKYTRKGQSLPTRGTIELNKVLTKDQNDTRRKRSNTFLFNIPTRKFPKKSSHVENTLQKDWQDQLLENVNILQGCSIKNKRNIKIQRDKIANYLKGKFANEVITNYYKFEPLESFSFLKNVIQELDRLNEKELKLITFFTYDVNQDGFICEEDIYHFISKLPHHSKILDDFNQIIEFLRKNKLRSNTTNLPEKLLKMRQKSLFSSLTEENPSNSKEQSQKKNSFTQKLFTVMKVSQKEPVVNQQASSFFRKFQINFEVFMLIFAEKLPVLVPQIITSLTEPIPSLGTYPPSESRRLSENSSPLETKEKQWLKRMSRTKEILDIFQHQNKVLSQKIV